MKLLTVYHCDNILDSAYCAKYCIERHFAALTCNC